jgi:hypothetical protein
VKALLCGVLPVPLAWIGIVLVEKFHGRGLLVPVMMVWALVVIAAVGLGSDKCIAVASTPNRADRRA